MRQSFTCLPCICLAVASGVSCMAEFAACHRMPCQKPSEQERESCSPLSCTNQAAWHAAAALRCSRHEGGKLRSELTIVVCYVATI